MVAQELDMISSSVDCLMKHSGHPRQPILRQVISHQNIPSKTNTFSLEKPMEHGDSVIAMYSVLIDIISLNT